jgi:hypothetical protein
MDRSDFYYKQNVTQAELDQAFSDCENADRALMEDHTDGDHALWGVLTGYEVTETTGTPDLNVQVANGYAYDEDGQRIPHTGGPTAVDLSTGVPGSDSRYVRVYVAFTRTLTDPRTDGDGASVDYRQAEAPVFSIQLGSIAASPVKPTIESNKVLLATVLLPTGKTQIFDADISMALDVDTSNPGDVDRQEGGVCIPHGRMGTRPVIFDPNASDVMLNMAGNDLQVEGGDIIMGDDLTPWNSGGRIFMEGGQIYNCGEIRVDGPPDPGVGYLYCDGSPSDHFGDLLEVDKPWDIPGESFMPAKQTTDPWSSGPTNDNNWALENFGTRIIWTMYWGGAAHGSARTGVYLRAPIFVPHKSKLVAVKLHLNVINTFTGFGDLDFVCGVAYQPKSSTSITVHTTKTYNAASGGIWTATGRGEIDAMTTGDTALTISNSANSYFLYCYHDDASGVGAARFVDIFHGTSETLIREASHVF